MAIHFSIVIATYKRPMLLSDAVRSVAKQTVAGDEIIIVNDDRETSISTFEGLSKIYIINNLGPRGASAARNLGVEKAKNDYVLFLDDDDLMVDNYLSILRLLITENRSAAWGSCNIELFDGQDLSFETYQPVRVEGCLWEKVASPAGKLFGAGCGFWVLRKLFLEAGGFDETLSNSEDVDLCCRLEQKSTEVYKIIQTGILVRRNYNHGIENVTARTTDLEKLQCWFSVYKKNRGGRSIFNKIRMHLLEKCIRRGVRLDLSNYVLKWLLEERKDPLVVIFIPIFIVKLIKKNLKKCFF